MDTRLMPADRTCAIRMPATVKSLVAMSPVTGDADWDGLLQLVLTDHAEGRRTSRLNVSPTVGAGINRLPMECVPPRPTVSG